jgi:hypothetical protein
MAPGQPRDEDHAHQDPAHDDEVNGVYPASSSPPHAGDAAAPPTRGETDEGGAGSRCDDQTSDPSGQHQHVVGGDGEPDEESANHDVHDQEAPGHRVGPVAELGDGALPRVVPGAVSASDVDEGRHNGWCDETGDRPPPRRVAHADHRRTVTNRVGARINPRSDVRY